MLQITRFAVCLHVSFLLNFIIPFRNHLKTLQALVKSAQTLQLDILIHILFRINSLLSDIWSVQNILKNRICEELFAANVTYFQHI